MKSQLCATLFNFFITTAYAASASEWRARSIYQILTDRFALTDNSGPICDTGERKYCGGTWKGIINHLDYIQAMGFDAIWISPVVQNIGNATAYGEAYHGYWAQDINALNSNFGTEQDMKDLSSALHSRGMYLMLDVVANHMAATSVPPELTFDEYVPFNSTEDYHPLCFIDDYTNQTKVEQCWLGDSRVPLADLNTESDRVVQLLNEWINYLVHEYSADGIRIDTVKHIRKDFWPAFVQSAGVFSLGEVLDERSAYTGDYTNYVDAVFDYPTWYRLTAAFGSPSGSIQALVTSLQNTTTQYKGGAFSTASFLENHDQPRFQSITQDQALVKNAIAFTFVGDGIPVTYYGQEQGYTGGAEPASREALWFTAYAQDKPLFKHIATLNKARKAAISASSSTFLSSPHKIAASTDNDIAILKPPMLAALTNRGSNAGNATFVVPGAYTANEDIVEILTCNSLKADGNGAVNVVFSAGEPHIYLSKSAVGSNLCSTISNSASTFKTPVWLTLFSIFSGAILFL